MLVAFYTWPNTYWRRLQLIATPTTNASLHTKTKLSNQLYNMVRGQITQVKIIHKCGSKKKSLIVRSKKKRNCIVVHYAIPQCRIHTVTSAIEWQTLINSYRDRIEAFSSAFLGILICKSSPPNHIDNFIRGISTTERSLEEDFALFSKIRHGWKKSDTSWSK